MQETRKEKLNHLKDYKVYKSLKNFSVDDFCQEFYMFNNLAPDWTKSFFDEKEKNDQICTNLIEFAHADGTGATFAIWLLDDIKIEESPIIYIGEVFNIVAKNMQDFLILLSLDSEFGDNIYRDCDDYEESTNHAMYCNWLKKTMSLKPIQNCNGGNEYPQEAVSISNEANKLYKLNFDTWYHNISYGTNLLPSEYEEEFCKVNTDNKDKPTDLQGMSSLELAKHFWYDNKKSLEYYKKAYEENPDEGETYEKLAEYYEDEKDSKSALKFYILSLKYFPSKCIEQDKRHISLIKLCKILKKDYLNICKEIIKESNDSQSHIVIMESYFNNNLIEKSFEHFKLAYEKIGSYRTNEDYVHWRKQFGIAGMFNKQR